jgi:hypothetical protein
MKYPPQNLYRETTTNSTFPVKNDHLDIDGNSKTSAGLANHVSFLFVAGITISVVLTVVIV